MTRRMASQYSTHAHVITNLQGRIMHTPPCDYCDSMSLV